jgi:hypothetical protein
MSTRTVTSRYFSTSRLVIKTELVHARLWSETNLVSKA